MGDDLEKIMPHLMDIKESLGGLSAQIVSSSAHLESVSRKADGIRKDFDSHKEDTAAHGAKAIQEAAGEGRASRADWLLAATFLISVVALILSQGAH